MLRDRQRTNESGQVLIFFILIFSLFLVIAAITIDYSLWLSDRRGVARAADLAVLAAAQDMPSSPGTTQYNTRALCGALLSCRSAFDWADRNGYGETDGADVTVRYFCGNNLGNNPPPGVCRNEPSPYGLTPCPSSGSEVGCDAINVTVETPGTQLFMRYFNVDVFNIGYSSWGNVSFKVIPIETALVLDASGSMGDDDDCNPSDTNPGCPIVEARIASNNFVTVLLNSGFTTSKVAYAPYRDCYNPPRTSSGAKCVPAMNITNGNCPSTSSSWVVCLTTNENTLRNRIGLTTATSNGTNICLGLFEARALLDGPGQSTSSARKRFVVLLSDGDNTYAQEAFGQGSPPGDCRPPDAEFGAGGGKGCSGSQDQEEDLDEDTWDLARDLEDDEGVEIYVVGFNVCGNPNNTTYTNSQCNSQIGNNNNDSTADRRLLKCVASSSPGTNDHYYEVDFADELPDIFQQVAFEIAANGLINGIP